MRATSSFAPHVLLLSDLRGGCGAGAGPSATGAEPFLPDVVAVLFFSFTTIYPLRSRRGLRLAALSALAALAARAALASAGAIASAGAVAASAVSAEARSLQMLMLGPLPLYLIENPPAAGGLDLRAASCSTSCDWLGRS